MQIIKAQNYTNITLSKREWCQIGTSSGWFKKSAEDVNSTKQKADTQNLSTLVQTLKPLIPVLQNPSSAQELEAKKGVCLEKVEDALANNFVVKNDAEIGNLVINLQTILTANPFNPAVFQKQVDILFNELNDSKEELTNQLVYEDKGQLIPGTNYNKE